MGVGSNVKEEEHAIPRKFEKLWPLNFSADVGVIERPGHMSSPETAWIHEEECTILAQDQYGAVWSAAQCS